MALDQEFEEELDEEEGQEMSFLEHLEELRWNIIRAVGSVLVFAILGWVYIQEIYQYVIIAPAKTNFWTYRMMCKLGEAVGAEGLCIDKIDFELQALGVGEQFSMALTSSVIIGLVFAFPYAFWEIWRFIKPGLKKYERKAARGAVFYVTFLFFSGVFFGYYVVTPLALNFLANFKLDDSIINEFSISSYISMVATLTLACGLAFQLPVVVFVLSRVGILTPSFMREYRRHSLIVILIVAAVITPSPDIYSQILVALPLTLLYEVSIIVSGRVQKAKEREEVRLAKVQDRMNND
ncbi:twin-arginine translocase subunit TatC [Persicitalea jodogahamensis]|uniref:Sec-independent protein translocase protein TatC n=1 Tax=Persicitalea jodogahamensis TaxID=402147 RepID=A0A8J3GCF1_9BACT|nr:twin-arginine translocase subunit TatC [Persicitalea jodogahamensis]GHB88463.1 Sec-independent protein translocase protein TatC [Persicitalea jodogahamensis]